MIKNQDLKIKYRAFGGFRFFLACLVMFWHSGQISKINDGILPYFKYGEMSVMIFFVLSGFVIFEAVIIFYKNRPLDFMYNRIIKLYPLYLAVLFSSVVLNYFYTEAKSDVDKLEFQNIIANVFSIFPFVFITDNILNLQSRIDFLSVIWAVRIEFAFYFAVFILMVVGKKIKFKKNYLFEILSALIGMHIYFVYLWGHDHKLAYYLGFSPYFILGVAFAGAAHGEIQGLKYKFIVLMSVALSVIHSSLYPKNSFSQMINLSEFGVLQLFPPLLFLIFLIIFLLLSKVELSARLKNIDKVLGDFSYPIYIIHYPIIFILEKQAGRNSVNLLIMSSMVFFLSNVVVNLEKKTIEKIRQRIRNYSFS